MAQDFYTFAGENFSSEDNQEREIFNLDEQGHVPYAARIAVYDDPSLTPRVVIINPTDIHSYLEEITNTVFKLSHEQGGTIPFISIREIVENFIHALFIQPTISILDNGNEIRFSDQGPGIKQKDLALEFGTSSATPYMKRYIRGVGSGLPNVQQYMEDKGGSLTIQDNISGGTIVTLCAQKHTEPQQVPYINQAQDHRSGTQQAPYQPGMTNSTRMEQTYTPYQVYSPSLNMYQDPYMINQYNPYGAQGFVPGMYPAQQNMHPTQCVSNCNNEISQQTYMQQPLSAHMNEQAGVSAPISSQLSASMTYQNGVVENFQQTPQTEDINNHVVQIPKRSKRAMSVFKRKEKIGPSDLLKEFGEGSLPTWSRALDGLVKLGFAQKNGQKFVLSEVGQHYLTHFFNDL